MRAMPAGCSKETRRLASENNWVIIDGLAGPSRVSAEAVRAADLVVLPAKPSPYDVGGVRHRGCREGSADQWWRRPQSRFRHHLGEDPHVPGKADCDSPRGIRVSDTYVRTTERVAYRQMATKGGRFLTAGTGLPAMIYSPCETRSRSSSMTLHSRPMRKQEDRNSAFVEQATAPEVEQQHLQPRVRAAERKCTITSPAVLALEEYSAE